MGSLPHFAEIHTCCLKEHWSNGPWKTYLHMQMEVRTCGMPCSCFINWSAVFVCQGDATNLCQPSNTNYSLLPSKDEGYKNLKGNLPTASLTLEHPYQTFFSWKTVHTPTNAVERERRYYSFAFPLTARMHDSPVRTTWNGALLKWFSALDLI